MPSVRGRYFVKVASASRRGMISAWGNGCALIWPNGADIALGVLYDWSQHVDAIVQRRRQRFAAEAPLLIRAKP